MKVSDRLIWALVPGFAAFALDGLIKLGTENGSLNIPDEGDKRKCYILEGRVQLRRLHNKGIAGGLFGSRQRAVAVVSFLMNLIPAFKLLAEAFKRKPNFLKLIVYSLVTGAAASNTADRFQRGYVVDYFSICKGPSFFRRLVFNISDFVIAIFSPWLF